MRPYAIKSKKLAFGLDKKAVIFKYSQSLYTTGLWNGFFFNIGPLLCSRTVIGPSIAVLGLGNVTTQYDYMTCPRQTMTPL